MHNSNRVNSMVPPVRLFEYYQLMARHSADLASLVPESVKPIFKEAEVSFLNKAEIVLQEINEIIEG